MKLIYFHTLFYEDDKDIVTWFWVASDYDKEKSLYRVNTQEWIEYAEWLIAGKLEDELGE